jgi:hypothetical protein
MPVHDVNIFGEKFKWAIFFQLHAFAWHVGEEKPEIDVKDFTTPM